MTTQTLTVTQVATRLECRPEFVRGLIHSRELRAINIGSKSRPRYRVREAVLEAFLSEREVLGVEEDAALS